MSPVASVTVQQLSSTLHDVEAVKFGNFKLKSGLQSPIYLDIRCIVTHPVLMKDVANLIHSCVRDAATFKYVCGVPYTALPIATALCIDHNVPMLMRRKEAKDYGTRKMVEGRFEKGETCLIVEDIVTTGGSVLETVELLRSEGLVVTDAVVLIDREQGGSEILASHGVRLHSVLTMSSLMQHLLEAELATHTQVSEVKDFVRANQMASKMADGGSSVQGGDKPKQGGDKPKQEVVEGLAINSLSGAGDQELTSVEEIVLKLHDVGAFKFGSYTLSNGMVTPIYMDLRLVISHPILMASICQQLHKMAVSQGLQYDIICGVPYAALHLATCISKEQNISMVLARKERKNYGTNKFVEGSFERGHRCVLVEDVCVSGQGVYETTQCLRDQSMLVSDCLLVVDREQGAIANLKDRGVKVHCLIQVSEALDILVRCGRVGRELADRCLQFLHGNPASIPEGPADLLKHKVVPFAERATLTSHPVTSRLFGIMAEKHTNLCLSADVNTTAELLQVAEESGPYICMLKMHVDILADVSKDTIAQLQAVAEKHNFLLFEDRKYSDIGNTVRLQYKGVADWAHVVTVHPLPGPGVITGLNQVSSALPRGCLLVAEMSSDKNLINASYTKASIQLAADHPDFVMGFICQSRLTKDLSLVHMTPGVKFAEGGDSCGQRYTSPKAAVGRGADVIIVGRGILQQPDRAAACSQYRDEAYQAYQDRC